MVCKACHGSDFHQRSAQDPHCELGCLQDQRGSARPAMPANPKLPNTLNIQLFNQTQNIKYFNKLGLIAAALSSSTNVFLNCPALFKLVVGSLIKFCAMTCLVPQIAFALFFATRGPLTK